MDFLKYHQPSLKMISRPPNFSGETFPYLPISVGEWYSLTQGLEWLAKYSPQDDPLHPTMFKMCQPEGKELLVFMYENQSVFWWAFENGNDDDPPVYINI